MNDKFTEYTDVLERLVGEMLACSPREWHTGALTIDCDGTRLNYKLKNEEAPGTATISKTLRDLIDELYVRMRDRGDTWTQAVITFNDESGSVTFKTSFTYERAPQSILATPSPTPQAKKPWWKFNA